RLAVRSVGRFVAGLGRRRCRIGRQPKLDLLAGQQLFALAVLKCRATGKRDAVEVAFLVDQQQVVPGHLDRALVFAIKQPNGSGALSRRLPDRLERGGQRFLVGLMQNQLASLDAVTFLDSREWPAAE